MFSLKILEKVSYVPGSYIEEEIYAGYAVVKNFKGEACMKFSIINEMTVTISIPIITLEGFEETYFQQITRQSRN